MNKSNPAPGLRETWERVIHPHDENRRRVALQRNNLSPAAMEARMFLKRFCRLGASDATEQLTQQQADNLCLQN